MDAKVTRRTVVSGALAIVPGAVALAAVVPRKTTWTMTQGIPDAHVRPATRWLLTNFGDSLRHGLTDPRIPLSLACAIACQESAYTWFDRPQFVQGRSPVQMMRLLVLDNVSPRGAFPRDTLTFLTDPRVKDLAADLIRIGDQSRVARGYKATGSLLFGYGLFQYDLQNILPDPAFWRDASPSDPQLHGQWGDVAVCTDRLVRELKAKLDAHPGDLHAAVAGYNGGGANARKYADIVLKFQTLAAQEIGA